MGSYEDDMALARRLQEEEVQAAAAALQSTQHARKEREFEGRLESSLATTLSYEDPLLRARALSVIPVQRIESEAQSEVSANLVPGQDVAHSAALKDAMVRALLKWFKRDFFKWVNSPPCDACGSATKGIGGVPPTDDERAHGAGRVENY
eukprot:gene32586-41415_t